MCSVLVQDVVVENYWPFFLTNFYLRCCFFYLNWTDCSRGYEENFFWSTTSGHVMADAADWVASLTWLYRLRVAGKICLVKDSWIFLGQRRSSVQFIKHRSCYYYCYYSCFCCSILQNDHWSLGLRGCFVFNVDECLCDLFWSVAVNVSTLVWA